MEVHDITHDAMLLLIKDGLRLYPACQLCLWQLLCDFQKLNLAQAKWTSKTYDKYFELNKRLKEWFNQCIKHGIIKYSYAPRFDSVLFVFCFLFFVFFVTTRSLLVCVMCLGVVYVCAVSPLACVFVYVSKIYCIVTRKSWK